MNGKYNATQLDFELKNAQIEIYGCSSDGRIDFKEEATQEQRELALVILLNHVALPDLI